LSRLGIGCDLATTAIVPATALSLSWEIVRDKGARRKLVSVITAPSHHDHLWWGGAFLSRRRWIMLSRVHLRTREGHFGNWLGDFSGINFLLGIHGKVDKQRQGIIG